MKEYIQYGTYVILKGDDKLNPVDTVAELNTLSKRVLELEKLLQSKTDEARKCCSTASL